MNNELSIVYLVTNASVVVQLVMFVLLAASVLAWTFIFAKRIMLNRASKVIDEFNKRFRSGVDLAIFYKELTRHDTQTEGIETIFVAGYEEFLRMQKQGVGIENQIENVQRVMRVELTKAVDELSETLTFLATVGSTSPYVGLFGTVWGIMNSFRALSDMKQATLSSVAPGIAEALIATAMGLFAAIPAVIAYNRFTTQLDRLAGRYALFIDEFVVQLQRQAHNS